jgi:exodeoxyribonuclease V alpha subunit
VELITRAVALLNAAPEMLEDILLRMLENAELVREVFDGVELIFPPHLARAEEEIARHLRGLSGKPSRYPAIEAEKAMAWVQKETGRELGPGQRDAVMAALTSRALIITGGPGVGKTTILQCILQILEAKNVKIVLAAPTGRAARRMSESTGQEAKTIHRLLEYQPGTGFQKNRSSPLKGDLFVLDETSMVDVSLMMHWLQALPENAHILLVGDVDQLPSVGPGNVLADIIRSGLIPVARLTEIFRQAAESRIITAAHEINSGHLPSLPKPAPKGCDFHFIERDTPEAIMDTLVHLVRDRIPNAFGLDPLHDIQVLSPMNRTPLGTNNLNVILQDALNPPAELKMEVERFGLTFRSGDKVIQTRNNYEKDVYNGDIGRVGDIESDPLRMHVHFEDGRSAIYESGDMDELRLAWAITIHKSQGSEFPAVVIPVSTQHYVMLQRNLLYTGITRGRKLVILLGDPKALAIAVKNAGGARRWSGLLPRMTGASTLNAK